MVLMICPAISIWNSRLSSWSEQKKVLRAEVGQPVITCSHSQRIPDHRTSIQRLYLASTLQIYPEDRGTNYSVWLRQTISRIVDPDLKHRA